MTGDSGKVQPLKAALRDLVGDGDTVFFGGFGHAIPFAAGHELIRQERNDLTLCRSGADILFDQLIAAGCVSKVIVGWIGNPGIGLAHSFSRALASNEVEIEEWTNFSLVLRLHAAALGVPFLPTRVLRPGDAADAAGLVERIEDPFTGESLAAVPALAPDVAVVHAQRADHEGNVQMWGVIGDSVEGALASRRVIATVAEIVDRDTVTRDPNRTVLPGYRVDAVCHVPWGAHPSYVQDHYRRDDAFYLDYDRLSRTAEGVSEFLTERVLGVPDRRRYLASLSLDDLATGPVLPPGRSVDW